MNDRYLCKAKRTDNGEWVKEYHFDFHGKTYITCLEETIIHAVYTEEPSVIDFDMRAFEVDPETLCQCIGLPDKDKTIMYENDIVRANGGVHGVIRFGKYGDMKTDYGFYIKWDKSQPYWRHDICYWQNEINVIGSYIDNPELLEGGAE